MKKLIELLNQYEKEKIINEGGSVDEDDNYFGWSIENGKIVNRDYDPDAHQFMDEYIISKKFEFIKWLVDNDKINFKKFDGDNYDYLENPIGSNNYDTVWDYKTIIQWLSISDTPIDDLIYYLK